MRIILYFHCYFFTQKFSSFHDIDGRSSEEAIRSWGGEAGELLLSIAVWDDMTLASTGAPLRYTSIKKAVHSWLKYQNAMNTRLFLIFIFKYIFSLYISYV